MYLTSFDSRKASPEELDQYRRSAVGVPADAQKLERANIDGVIYSWQCEIRGAKATMLAAFAGRRTKAEFFIWTPNKAQAEKRVNDFFTGLEQHAAYKAQQRAVAAAGPDMSLYPVGAILHCQYGYDMTINEYYQVVKVKGQSVTIRQITSETVSGDGGYSGTERPVKDSFIFDAQELARRVTRNGVKVDRKHASLWSGSPNYFNTLD